MCANKLQEKWSHLLLARAFRERHPQLGQQPLSSLANYPQPKIVYDLSTLRTYVQTQNSLELYLGNFLIGPTVAFGIYITYFFSGY